MTDISAQFRVAVQFLQEQHKGMTGAQIELAARFTTWMLLEGVKPNNDTAVAIRAVADFIDFAEGLKK